MIRTLRAWWALLELGPLRQVAKQMEEFFRYTVINLLAEEGLFRYLETRRTYGEILAHFGYDDSDYARDLLDLLATEKRSVLIKRGDSYQLNPDEPPPDLEEILAQTAERHHDFLQFVTGVAQNIPARLRREPVEFTESFEAEGREMAQRFDRSLGIQIYRVSRNVAFALLKREERAWLRGKTLLDVGCGSGPEPAEIWMHLDGDVRMTAVDPIVGLLERAEKSFAALVKEIDPEHPPIVDGNRPVFQKASVTELPFDDESFDAVFYSHVLQWTSDPSRAVSEIVRVLKPGGLVFGMQIIKPSAGPYGGVVIRSNENSHGFFWKEEHQDWYAAHGIALEVVTPVGAFRARKP